MSLSGAIIARILLFSGFVSAGIRRLLCQKATPKSTPTRHDAAVGAMPTLDFRFRSKPMKLLERVRLCAKLPRLDGSRSSISRPFGHFLRRLE